MKLKPIEELSARLFDLYLDWFKYCKSKMNNIDPDIDYFKMSTNYGDVYITYARYYTGANANVMADSVRINNITINLTGDPIIHISLGQLHPINLTKMIAMYRKELNIKLKEDKLLNNPT